MANKIIHHAFFLNAFRTALIFITSILIYEILKTLERKWNETHPNNAISHFAQRKTYHFIIIFIIDLLILYLFALFFDVHL